MDVDFVPDDQSTVIERLVPDHAEVFAVQCTAGGESGSGIPPGVVRDAVERPDERDFFGHAAQREGADNLIGVPLFLRGVHFVRDRRELFDVQEIGVAEMRIAFFLVRIDRCRLNSGLDRLEGFRGVIHHDGSPIVHETPGGFGDQHVNDTKLNDRVIRIDVPPSGFRADA